MTLTLNLMAETAGTVRGTPGIPLLRPKTGRDTGDGIDAVSDSFEAAMLGEAAAAVTPAPEQVSIHAIAAPPDPAPEPGKAHAAPFDALRSAGRVNPDPGPAEGLPATGAETGGPAKTADLTLRYAAARGLPSDKPPTEPQVSDRPVAAIRQSGQDRPTSPAGEPGPPDPLHRLSDQDVNEGPVARPRGAVETITSGGSISSVWASGDQAIRVPGPDVRPPHPTEPGSPLQGPGGPTALALPEGRPRGAAVPVAPDQPTAPATDQTRDRPGTVPLRNVPATGRGPDARPDVWHAELPSAQSGSPAPIPSEPIATNGHLAEPEAEATVIDDAMRPAKVPFASSPRPGALPHEAAGTTSADEMQSLRSATATNPQALATPYPAPSFQVPMEALQMEALQSRPARDRGIPLPADAAPPDISARGDLPDRPSLPPAPPMADDADALALIGQRALAAAPPAQPAADAQARPDDRPQPEDKRSRPVAGSPGDSGPGGKETAVTGPASTPQIAPGSTVLPGSDALVTPPALAGTVPSSAAQSPTPPAPPTELPPPPQPAPLTVQIAVAASQGPGQPVELRLSPDELGHVRLHLSASDGVATVVIAAERAETLDLIRRNADDLARDFRDLGYRDVSFSFSQEQRSSARHDAGGPPPSKTEPGGQATSPQAHPYSGTPRPAATAAGGLDIRL